MISTRSRRPFSRLANAHRMARVLRDLGREIARHERDVAAPLGLSPVQSQALQAAAEDGPTSMNDLAERMCIAPSTATRLVDQLEQRGWVTRHTDPADRRRNVVALTAAGEDLAEQLQALGQQALWMRLPRLREADTSVEALEDVLGALRGRG
jgi:DNA-binding MarR family transcriptional regulator